MSNELKESIVWSFRKCGIMIALDGSEDHDINIRGLEGYTVGVLSSERGEDNDESLGSMRAACANRTKSLGSDDESEPDSNSGDEDKVGKRAVEGVWLVRALRELVPTRLGRGVKSNSRHSASVRQ